MTSLVTSLSPTEWTLKHLNKILHRVSQAISLRMYPLILILSLGLSKRSPKKEVNVKTAMQYRAGILQAPAENQKVKNNGHLMESPR